MVAGLLPGLGTLSDRIGHRPMFIAGLAVFGLASLVAAYAPSPSVLIGARVLLAVGAGLMMPATLSIVRLTFADAKERALAMGVWAAVASGGAALGPLIGGLLLEYFWWGSVFLINVPLVVLALVSTLVFIPHWPGNPKSVWDPLGSMLILVGLVALAFAIKEPAMARPSLWAAAGAAVLGTASLGLFVRHQRRSPTPMIEFRLFRNRAFAWSVVIAMAAAFSDVGLELVLTQRLQLALDYSAVEAAVFLLPGSLLAFVGGPLAGWLAPRWGIERVMMVSMFLGGLGVAGLFPTANAGAVLQLACLGAFGLGMGGAMAMASHVIMSGAPVERAGMAASMEEVAFELGGAIGITVLGSLLAGVYSAMLVLPKGEPLPSSVYEGIDQALGVAEGLGADAARVLTNAVHEAFDVAYLAALALNALLLLAVAVAAWRTAKAPAS